MNNLNTKDFYYDLPEELIAQTPIQPRDASRMLVYHLDNKSIEHKHFYNIVDYLQEGDLIVLNNTKVIPARIFGTRISKDSTQDISSVANQDKNTEVLLLKRLDYTKWECLTRPAKKLRIGTKIYFSEQLFGEVVGFGEEGIRIIEFSFDGVFENILEKIGNMPLPPYITTKLQDKTRYQTVYSKFDGSSAAPTAGLHWTNELLEKVKNKGVQVANVLLHVGLGTFRPVKESNILAHKMHSEYYEIDKENAKIINQAVKENRRIICVGTTSVRVLESVADSNGYVKECCGNTEIFIYPSYKFKIVKGLITNFHLPESTLIMLVSALVGREETLNMYSTAVQERYRFFSFGDATLII